MDTTKPTEKPYLSNSQLQMYEKCGEMYRRRYIMKEIIPPGFRMLKGTGVHGGAKINFTQKIESHVDMPVKDIIDASVSEFDMALQKGSVLLTSEEEAVGKSKVEGQVRDSIAAVSSVYALEVAPLYQPVLVEKKHKIELVHSTHDLVAVMDLADDKKRVIDLKVTGKKKSQNDVDVDEQLTFYALIHLGVTGELPSAVMFENIVDRTSAKTLKRTTERNSVSSTRSADDCRSLVHRINTMIHGLDKGVFIPANATSWWCNEKWCGYAHTCPYYIKPKGAIQEEA